MLEWHLSPEFILENWTDEQFERFWQARNQRVLETNRAMRQPSEETEQPNTPKWIPDTEMMSLAGIGEA